VLSEIPIKGAILDWNSFGSYRSVWTKGSSAALFTVGGKWGPKEVFVIPVSTSKVGEVSNLTSEIGRLVLPDLEKSGVPPIDDDYGFIFVDEDYIKDSQGASMDESTYWTISDKSTIAIRCICTTDPKHLADKIWEVIFEGTWDIGQKKFTQYKITHIAQDRLLPF
jgi:hypothetical protein